MRMLLHVARVCMICAWSTCYAQEPLEVPAPRIISMTLGDDTLASFQKWAGGDISQYEITKETLSDFLTERLADINAAANPRWSAWLKNMGNARTRELRAWALARRIEAGDLTDYLAYEELVSNHLMAISKPGYGQFNLKATSNNVVASIPSPLHIDPRSDFWRVFENTIRKSPTLNSPIGLYAIWCFNTRPDQRELIFDLAKYVLVKEGGKKYNNVWNDPKFWIIMDWLYPWGERDDFEKALELLPNNAKSVFNKLFSDVKRLPGFFDSRLNLPNPLINSRNSPTSAVGQKDEAKEDKEVAEKNSLAITSADVSVIPDDLKNAEKTAIVKNINFIPPKVKKMRKIPPYPDVAMRLNVVTVLKIQLAISKDGKVTGCRPRPGPWQAFFAPEMIRWAKTILFEPAMMNGEPIETTFNMEFRFQRGN